MNRKRTIKRLDRLFGYLPARQARERRRILATQRPGVVPFGAADTVARRYRTLTNRVIAEFCATVKDAATR